MSRGKPDALVVVWDIGIASKVKSETNQKTFLHESFKCLRRIIVNKMLVQKSDVMSIVTIGSDNTKNAFNNQKSSNFINISVDFDLDNAKLDMIGFVEETKSTEKQADWLGGMAVALDVLKKSPAVLKKKSIVLMSPLSERVNHPELRILMKQLAKHDVELTVIGAIDPNEGGDPSENAEDQIDGNECISLQAALTQLSKEINAQVYSIAEAEHELVTNYTSRQVNPRPWKVDFEIGSVIKIKVCGVNEISEEETLKFKTLTDRDMTKVVVKETTHFERGTKRQLEEFEEIIQGHKFGTSIIPFSVQNQADMTYKTGAKSLKLYSFTDKSLISPAMYIGKGQQTFYPEPTDKGSCRAFSAFVQAMIALDQVALVRKVPNMDGRLIFAVMHPEVREPGGERLILVELPFAEDARKYLFKPEQMEVTDKNMAACQELINSTNLKTAMLGGQEAFKSRDVPSPALVYQQEAIVFRIRYPDETLPPPSDYCRAILEPPTSMKLALEKMGPKLNAAFPNLASERTKTARPGTTKKSDDAGPSDAAADPVMVTQPLWVPPPQTRHVVAVGEESPAADIQMLIHQGMGLQDVFNQAKRVVTQLGLRITDHSQVPEPLEAVRALRTACRNQGEPMCFNEWLHELREELTSNGSPLLWQGIQEENLGLLTQSETPLSSVTNEEARNFLGEGSDDSD